jgi:NAD(P)-dependent dehydrogenase (short-subunit alcohol dehydrogenase family)
MQPRRTAIVTGGRRGIGAAIAAALARTGFDILLADLEEDADARHTREAVEGAGSACAFVPADIGDRASHARIIARAAELPGELAVLVNNAGVSSLVRGDMLDLAEESFDRAVRVNLRGTFFLTQAFARHLIGHPPEAAGTFRAIITITSINAEILGLNRADYCITKAGLSMMTKLFAARLAEEAINVYEIRPGMIRTEMTAVSAERYNAFLEAGGVPIARWGEPEDVGKAAAMLAAGHLDFSTGSAIFADGGMQLHRI